MTRIGVAISTRDRRPMLLSNLPHWINHLPAGAELVIIDDASQEPLASIDGVTVIRHDYRHGIAMTKNRGIAALIDAGCTDLFLADDDIHPTTPDWWRPYVESPEPHLHHGWEHRQRKTGDATGWPPTVTHHDSQHTAYSFPRGVMLYLEDRVVDVVGGMNTAHGAFSGEHVEYSGRIHDAGLTRWAFADITGSEKLWYSHDRSHGNTTGSSLPLTERRHLHKANGIHWARKWPGWPNFPYREGAHTQDWNPGPPIAQTEHYSLLRHITKLHPAGTALEFGVGRGDSLRIIAREMPAIGFDSFQGLPEDWRPEFRRGAFRHPQPRINNTHIIPGLYNDTLPNFTCPNPIGLVHIDCDLYSSTATVLNHIGPHLKPGTYVVFDEFWGYDDGPGMSWRDHEHRAWREYADRTNIGWTVIAHSGEAWAIRIL